MISIFTSIQHKIVFVVWWKQLLLQIWQCTPFYNILIASLEDNNDKVKLMKNIAVSILCWNEKLLLRYSFHQKVLDILTMIPPIRLTIFAETFYTSGFGASIKLKQTKKPLIINDMAIICGKNLISKNAWNIKNKNNKINSNIYMDIEIFVFPP